MKQKLIIITGPTASGKTEYAVTLAKMIGGEIVCADSMQIYSRMSIGTARPTEVEMDGVSHHLFGFVSPDTKYSCAQYRTAALSAIDDIISCSRVPILCGGTGLYIDAVTTVSTFSEDTERDEQVRTELSTFAESRGAAALHDMLYAVDPKSADTIHPNNVRRVIRALEIYRSTGITKSEWDIRSRSACPFDCEITVLDYALRDTLNERINRRVDIMMERGLEAEAHALYEDGIFIKNSTAAQAIGYKEFLPYFAGEAPLSSVVENIKLNTRHYAKRQQTWFKRYTDAIRIYK